MKKLVLKFVGALLEAIAETIGTLMIVALAFIVVIGGGVMIVVALVIWVIFVIIDNMTGNRLSKFFSY